MVSANSEEDKSRWLDDLSTAISDARSRQDDAFHYLSLRAICEYNVTLFTCCVLVSSKEILEIFDF